MAETVRKNLGMVTAYAYAVSKGYTGTEEEFAELMASYADVAQDAEASAQAAAQSATTAEQKATQAAGSAANAAVSATSASESAQAAAGSSNSANLHAQNASASATNAAGSASSASTYAGNASASAQAAEGSANDAQTSATQAAGSATTATAKADEAATSATTAVEAAQRAEDAAATLVIDDTLTHAGQAADAKKTGDEIGELKENLGEIIGAVKADPDFRSGFYTNNGGILGAFTENDRYSSCIIKVNVGETYRIYGKGTNAARLWSTHSADGTTIRLAESSVNASSNPVDVIIGSTEKYLCFNSSNTYNPHIYFYGGDSFIQNNRKYIENVENDLKNLEDAIDGGDLVKIPVNIFDGTFPESGYFDEHGADVSSTIFKRSGYIPIDGEHETLYFLRTYQPYQIEACFYNSSKVAVSERTTVYQNAWTILKSSIAVPDDASYLRIYTNVSAYQPDLMIGYYDYPMFVDYGKEYYSIKDAAVKETMLASNIITSIKPLIGKTVVFMGDSIIGNFYNETGICAIMQNITGANIINCAFGGTRMAYRHGTSSGQIAEFNRWNTISGAGLADAIASDDWLAQEEAIPAMTSWKPAYFPDRLNTIESVDWNNVDYILWEYGTNDFESNCALENANDATDMYAYVNAYRHTIETILSAYPNIRIISITPIWRFWLDDQDAYIDDSNTHEIEDYTGVSHKLTDFVAKAMEVSREYQIACIDNYHTTCMNVYTKSHFFDATDGTHPNAEGRSRIAKHLAGQLLPLI